MAARRRARPRDAALVGACSARSRRSSAGTTAIVDHHESPERDRGQPRRDRRRLRRGRRAGRVLPTASPTATAPTAPRRGLAENERFLRGGGRGLRRRRTPRSRCSRRHARGRGRPRRRPRRRRAHPRRRGTPIDATPRARLARLTADDWLLVHCVHLDRRTLPGTIAHNPRSNMNNAVGYARPARFAEPGRARHRRHRRRHARGVPPRLRPACARTTSTADARRRVDVARRPASGWCPRPRDDRVTWSLRTPMEPWHLAFTPGVRAARRRGRRRGRARRRRGRPGSTPTRSGPRPPSRPRRLFHAAADEPTDGDAASRLYLQDAHPIREAWRYAQYAEARGLRRRVAGREPARARGHGAMAAFAAVTERIKVGSGVVDMLDPQPGPPRGHLLDARRPRPGPGDPRHRRVVGPAGGEGRHRSRAKPLHGDARDRRPRCGRCSPTRP